MKLNLAILSFLLISTLGTMRAQFTVYPANHIPVLHGNGIPMTNPWTGGLNAIQLSMFDADGDGNQDDIYIFDRSGSRSMVFVGTMVGDQRFYKFSPSLSSQFPSLARWVLLRDFDCDGKQDIFTNSPQGGGFAVYRNTTPPGGPLSFEVETSLLMSRYAFNSGNVFNTNIYTSPLDIPAVVDADGDGDLDIFTFSVTGTQMEYHENLSMDSTGVCGVTHFRAGNLCYGQFKEGQESNEIFLGDPCGFNVLNPKSDDPDGLRHVGTTILALDADADGLLDIVLGGVSFNNLSFLQNSVGSNGVDSIISYVSDFPAALGGPAVDLDNFVGSFYEDVTGNGKKDLIAGVNDPFFARNTRSIWLYENLGEDDAPIFSFVQQDFLQDGTIDHGEVAAPIFADVNNDGLIDMVVGSRGKFVENSVFKPALALYLNIGSADSPVFQLANDDWLNLEDLGTGQYAHPSFGDLDGDGDLDLVVGDNSGRIHWFENTAGPDSPMALSYVGFVNDNLGTIDVGQAAAPQLYDLDGDGRQDLIIGERNGNLNYYRNNTGSNDFNFELITESLGDLTTVEPGFFIGNSSPHFFEHEGTTLLLLGTERGRLHLYSGIDGNELGPYTLESLVAFGVDAGEKSRPFVVDIDNDGLKDIFCGSIGGGMLLFSGDATAHTTQATQRKRLHIYPNPASDYVRVELDTDDRSGRYVLYDVAGRAVDAGRYSGDPIAVNALKPGIYIIEVTTSGGSERGVWVKE